MRIARNRDRTPRVAWLSATLILIVSATSIPAQGTRSGQRTGQNPPANSKVQAKSAAGTPAVGDAIIKEIPVNPSDPVAIINGEIITRQQLANECVVRKGEEVLDALIARTLMEQAMRARKLTVSAAEIDAEIEHVAQTVARVSREVWLRELAKTKNISPGQYARDIIYPQLALRKLAGSRVEVTDQDMKDALEAQFGEQLSYRMIMTRSLSDAKQIWEHLNKHPGSFETVARTDARSIDQATRADGGKPINGPLQRHSAPRAVTDEIFRQLVDGDPEIHDPAAAVKEAETRKPKDGDISGPIQVMDEAWLIVKRETVIPARPYDANDANLRKQMREAIVESKLQQHMEQVYNEIIHTANIENKLTGTTKVAVQELPPVDRQIQQSNAPTRPGAVGTPTRTSTPAAASRSLTPTTGAASKAATRVPAGVSPDDVETAKLIEGAANTTQTKK